MGSPKIPVILVQFPNKHFVSGLAEGDSCTDESKQELVRQFYDKYCNGDGTSEYWKDGGSFGSIREYFRDQSNGQFTPEFVVIGPVTLDNSYGYYGANSANSHDVRISTFYADAMKKAVKTSEMLALNIYNTAITKNLWGQGQAKAIMFFIMLVIVSLVQVSINKRREVEM